MLPAFDMQIYYLRHNNPHLNTVQCACFSYANIAPRCHNTSHHNTQDTMLHAFHMQL